MRARRNRILAWVAAGVLILSLTLAGMIIYLGRFQGPDTGTTAPGIASTVPPGGQSRPLAPVSPTFNGSLRTGAETGDGAAEGGLHIRTSVLTPRGVNASTALNGSARSANGG